MKKVTIVIPCYNVENYIKEVMEGILDQTYKPIEILLINDGSTDKTLKLIKKYQSKKIRIINHPFNLGLASVRNTAIIYSKGDYIAYLDGDVVPDKDWLKKVIKFFDEDKKIAGVGGRLIEKYINTCPDKWRKIHMSQSSGKEKKEVEYLAGCNCIYRKKALIDVGIYDTSNKTNGEDTFISFKLKKLGYKLIFEPEAVAYHLRKDNLCSVIRTRWGWANGKKNIKSPEVYSLSSLFFKSFVGFGWTLKCLKKDLIEKNMDLLYIDLFMPFYWSYYTFKKYLSHKKEELKSIKNSINGF